jgi:hypothetical protein
LDLDIVQVPKHPGPLAMPILPLGSPAWRFVPVRATAAWSRIEIDSSRADQRT